MTKPREAKPTVQFIDSYGELYKDLFPEVRAYEYFKYLLLGLISDIKRKSLPEIAKIVGLENAQGLHHFVTESPWEVEAVEKRRLAIILRILEMKEIEVIIDETGDKKKGETTDYVARQYIGRLGKVENGIVSVNAYAYCEGMTFPLISRVYKPKSRLKEGEKYKSKPEIAMEIIRELVDKGFKVSRVLADSEYGESHSNFISGIEELKIEYAVAIRSDHGVWLKEGEKVRANQWRKFDHVTWEGKKETRYIREIIYGKKREVQYWEITMDKDKATPQSTWFVMIKIPNLSYHQVEGIYQHRGWIEYGFKESKSELGWADYRVTDYSAIQRWWELVMVAYLMVSLHSNQWNSLMAPIPEKYQKYPGWNKREGWKNYLNNLRLILQPYIYNNVIRGWLRVFPNPQLSSVLSKLISLMNGFDCLRFLVYLWDDFCFSSA